METVQLSQVKSSIHFSKVISGSFLIAGTAIGAGMLGIPLASGASGFMPACAATLAVWFFMLCSGLALLEVTLWMPEGANILSMCKRLLGRKGELLAGGMFLFLYYCLIVAYIAAGSPLLNHFFGNLIGVELPSFLSYFLFTFMLGGIVLSGAVWIDRINILLTIGLIVAFAWLMASGFSSVQSSNLHFYRFSAMPYALPVLFGAFGYHNVIPSLTTYLKKDKDSLRLSIILGTIIALIIYLVWQYLMIGAVPQASMQEALDRGFTSVQALEGVTGNPILLRLGQFFAIFAIMTSLLGVSFSMVDFYRDGFSLFKRRPNRFILCLLVFLPSCFFTMMNPEIFNHALGIAGGIGEAFLNGVIPVWLVLAGRYTWNLAGSYRFFGEKKFLYTLLAGGVLVMLFEAYVVFF